MSQKLEQSLLDSDRIGGAFGLAVELTLYPKFLLISRDIYLRTVYENTINRFRKLTAENIFKHHAEDNKIKAVIFDDTVETETITNPNPETNTLSLRWSKQVEWAKRVMKRGLVGNVEMGEDFLEAWETLISDRYFKRAINGLQKIQARELLEKYNL